MILSNVIKLFLQIFMYVICCYLYVFILAYSRLIFTSVSFWLLVWLPSFPSLQPHFWRIVDHVIILPPFVSGKDRNINCNYWLNKIKLIFIPHLLRYQNLIIGVFRYQTWICIKSGDLKHFSLRGSMKYSVFDRLNNK